MNDRLGKIVMIYLLCCALSSINQFVCTLVDPKKDEKEGNICSMTGIITNICNCILCIACIYILIVN